MLLQVTVLLNYYLSSSLTTPNCYAASGFSSLAETRPFTQMLPSASSSLLLSLGTILWKVNFLTL